MARKEKQEDHVIFTSAPELHCIAKTNAVDRASLIDIMQSIEDFTSANLHDELRDWKLSLHFHRALNGLLIHIGSKTPTGEVRPEQTHVVERLVRVLKENFTGVPPVTGIDRVSGPWSHPEQPYRMIVESVFVAMD